MEFLVKQAPLDSIKTDCLVLTIDSSGKFNSKLRNFDKKANGLLGKVLRRNNIQGNVGETLFFQDVPGVSADRVLLVGLGDPTSVTLKSYRKLVSSVAKQARDHKINSFTCDLLDIPPRGSQMLQRKVDAIVNILYSQNYTFTEQKNYSKKDFLGFKKITLISSPSASRTSIRHLIRRFMGINQGINLAKNLANRSANVCTPKHLATETRKIARKSKKISVAILEKKDMQKLGMGALLAVARGSTEPAKLIVANYKGTGISRKPIVLIGKGVTFDSGGISLKPGSGMDEMKYDMAGAASVLGCIEALSILEPEINVVALIPATENMPDGKAIKPGDIIKSLSGKTVEILNTDAEGRLILCDTLTYCSKFKPECVIDVATLTGACVVALGKHATGMLSNDNGLAGEILEAGEKANDRAWQLPLWEEYRTQLNSPFADIANVGGRSAGTITAAMFLAEFAKPYKWAHLDIAGTAWNSGASKGATGRPVSLLMEFILSRAAKRK